MTATATQFETAGNLQAFGAVMVDHSDPTAPVVYRAAHGQDASTGVVHLTMDEHSRKLQVHKAQATTKMDRKYAALEALSPKAGARAAELQNKGFGRYQSMTNNRAALRNSMTNPMAKPSTKPAAKPVQAAQTTATPAMTKTMSVGQLSMRKPETTSLDQRMRQLGAFMGFNPQLAAFA